MEVAILGAGPIGLEAALAAVEHGHTATVYERAPTVGGHVRRWGHVRLFTPWSMNVSERARAELGDLAPEGEELPTGEELVAELLEPLAASTALAGSVRTSANVLAVGREGLLKHEEIAALERAGRRFRLLIADGSGAERSEFADVVIDATGTYGNPNRLGDGGIEAPGERALEDRITRTLEPLEGLAGSTVLLTGAGHSAQTAVVELARDRPPRSGHEHRLGAARQVPQLRSSPTTRFRPGTSCTARRTRSSADPRARSRSIAGPSPMRSRRSPAARSG